jgi:putative hemolysin
MPFNRHYPEAVSDSNFARNMVEKKKFIDIDEVFKKKNPRIYKMLPGFVIKYIKRVVHQDELNEALWHLKDFYGLEFVRETLDYMGIKYTVIHEDKIPRSGRYIFVGNHPLGGLDGMVLMDAVGKYLPNVKSISNDLLLNLENMRTLFLPVNKHGRQSSEYFKLLEQEFESESQILNFPAGLCSRKIKGKIIDLDWKKSFVKKAIQHKRDIVPVHFIGKNSNFFYNLANLRKFFGIKANLEMFYLVDELYKQKGKPITMIVGDIIPYSSLDSSRNHQEWADHIKKIVYQLRENQKIKNSI